MRFDAYLITSTSMVGEQGVAALFCEYKTMHADDDVYLPVRIDYKHNTTKRQHHNSALSSYLYLGYLWLGGAERMASDAAGA
jgi:hypothetical protein